MPFFKRPSVTLESGLNGVVHSPISPATRAVADLSSNHDGSPQALHRRTRSTGVQDSFRPDVNDASWQNRQRSLSPSPFLGSSSPTRPTTTTTYSAPPSALSKLPQRGPLWRLLFTGILLACMSTGLLALYQSSLASSLYDVVRLRASSLYQPSSASAAQAAAHVVGPAVEADGSPFRSLDERLDRLFHLPIFSQDDLAAYGRENCPEGNYRREAQQRTFEWMFMDNGFVERARAGLVGHLRRLENDGHEVVWNATLHEGDVWKQGIILAGGNPGSTSRILIALQWIRGHLKSDIPIEIFSYQDELTDPTERASLEQYGVMLRTVDESHDVTHRSYGIKGKALLQSSFQQFLYLDSDAIPLQPIEAYFESYELQVLGSAFYNDLSKDSAQNPIWRVLGRACSDEHWTAETGQILYDKSGNNGLNLAVLHLSDYMLSTPDYFKNLGWGDKDLPRYGFYALDLPYSQAPRIFAPLGGARNSLGIDSAEDDPCGHSMLHWALTPMGQQDNASYVHDVGFIHSNQLKHFANQEAHKLFTTVRKAIKDRTTDKETVRTQYKHRWEDLCLVLELVGPDGRASDTRTEWDGQAVETLSFQDVLATYGGNGDVVNGTTTWEALQLLAQQIVLLPSEEVN